MARYFTLRLNILLYHTLTYVANVINIIYYILFIIHVIIYHGGKSNYREKLNTLIVNFEPSF